ncbi:MAG: acetylxylan esterase [Tidjanibacter sp.]|nr:acetylxylan esterase [Tidjanibacter sp.]
MKRYLIFSLLLTVAMAATSNATAQNALVGIPVNYDESKAGDYKATLPDPLIMLDGTKVTTAKQWEKKRRPEIIKLFEEHQHGKWPAKKTKIHYNVEEDLGLGGSAVRKQTTIYFSPNEDGPKVDVLIYLPKEAKGPVPLLLNVSFTANNITVSDPGVKEGYNWDEKTKTKTPAKSSDNTEGFKLDETIKRFLNEGFGFATLHYTDIEPDFLGGISYGVRSLYLKPGEEPAADEWGAISAWAWGISRVMDYFEKDPDIDAKRIAITGLSRLGKTIMWAAARDQRIAVVLSSCSGEGGAAISRRNFGETIGHLVEKTRFPYWYAANYSKYGADVTKLPVDAHMLVALIAPRPCLLQTGSTDNFSDSKGEFYSAIEAGKVYRLLGKDDLGTTELPKPNQPIYHTLGYFMHEGGHTTLPTDWNIFLEYCKRYL